MTKAIIILAILNVIQGLFIYLKVFKPKVGIKSLKTARDEKVDKIINNITKAEEIDEKIGDINEKSDKVASPDSFYNFINNLGTKPDK